MKKEQDTGIVIKLSQDADIQNARSLRAYVVDGSGKIVDTASFDGAIAQLQTRKDQLHGNGKIYIGQVIPPEAINPNEDTLTTMRAYQPVLSFDKSSIAIDRLPSEILIPFPWHFCHVKGQLRKNFIIDGRTVTLPVCHARVHICNVERIFFWPVYIRPKFEIPDWVLEDLRNKFNNLHISIPKTPPKPGPDPAPFERNISLKTNLSLRTLGSKPAIQKNLSAHGLQPLPDHILNGITAGSLQTIRQTLIEHHEILHPYLCLWPIFWPWFYWMYEEAVVDTDCNGQYDAWLFTFNNTQRNIYIWVEVQINGQWVTVYRPPLPCYTHWNYACGTDININVTDVRVHPCDCSSDGPVDAVWFRSVGESASALHIEQNPASSIVLQGANLDNAGCTDIHYGQKISPFGGGLYLKLFCGRDIFNAGVTHYRWKKTMIADANQNAIPVISQATSIVAGNVNRPYLVRLSTTHYETHAVTLGADGTGTDIAYHIPHQDISAETLIPVADQSLSPEWSNVFFDSAYIDSNSLTEGVYKFELELLKKEVNGSFTVVPVAKSTFQVSAYNAIGNSQDAPNNYLNINTGNALKADAFKMNIRIDNAICGADIHDAMLVETGALSSKCGFIKYDNSNQHVRISFEASHPRNFASFSFGIIKGNNTEGTGVAASGYVLSGVDGFTLTGVVFAKDVPVTQLLGTCPGQAAFAENLTVAALATNGSSRLNEYDRPDTNAFALSNV